MGIQVIQNMVVTIGTNIISVVAIARCLVHGASTVPDPASRTDASVPEEIWVFLVHDWKVSCTMLVKKKKL